MMGAEQAVGVVHRRALAAAPDPVGDRRRLVEEYAAEHLGAFNAAGTGAVDEVIHWGQTRSRLASALSVMARSQRVRSAISTGAWRGAVGVFPDVGRLKPAAPGSPEVKSRDLV